MRKKNEEHKPKSEPKEIPNPCIENVVKLPILRDNQNLKAKKRGRGKPKGYSFLGAA
jgi:hypothetical protein